MSHNTFLGLFWLTGSYLANGMRMTVSSMFLCLIPLPWVCMVVQALAKVRACSPTLSYITSVNMMTIFHGFMCRCVASMAGGKQGKYEAYDMLYICYVISIAVVGGVLPRCIKVFPPLPPQPPPPCSSLSMCVLSMCLVKHLLFSTVVGLQNKNCFCNLSVACVHLLHT